MTKRRANSINTKIDYTSLFVEMQSMKQRLFDAGLIRSFHKMDLVTKEAGYELGELIERKRQHQ